MRPRCRPGNQVGHRDVEKARRGEGEEVRQHARDDVEREEGGNRAERRSRSADSTFSSSARPRE